MSTPEHASAGIQSVPADPRFRRLTFRSWRRGTQESDLILGSFADAFLSRFDAEQLDRFEALLECSDAELFDWTIGGHAPPLPHEHDVMRLLRDFCASLSRIPPTN